MVAAALRRPDDDGAAAKHATQMEATVLIVDDDERLRDLLQEYLQGFGYRIEMLPDAMEVVPTIRRIQPDLVILDIMMPGKDGFEALSEIRREVQIPVIMLTARGEDTDRIVGLEMGADDYLPKPFNPRELLARIRAIFRRMETPGDAPAPLAAQAPSGTGPVRTGPLELHRTRRTLRVEEGAELELSTAEFRLLEVMMERPNLALSRDELMNLTRGRDFMAFERSIDVHISKLRQKLKKLGQPERIKTVWGTGYMFVVEEDETLQ